MGYSNHVLVILINLVLTPLIITADDEVSSLVIAPHCTSVCGNVTIPYPFGIEKGCYYEDKDDLVSNSSKKLICDHTMNPPKPILSSKNITISNISLEQGEILVDLNVSYKCFTKKGVPTATRIQSANLPNFTISSTKNNLVVIGCDTYAWFIGSHTGERYYTGCMTRCDNLNMVIDDHCHGVGCCRTWVPEGATSLTTTPESFGNHSYVGPFNPCSVAFPVATDSFVFKKEDLSRKSDYYLEHPTRPVMFNWGIGTKNCTVAEVEGSCLCKNNTICKDNLQGGYLCNCKDGYTGNPYLPQGCKDVDECAAGSNSPCSMVCINTPGSFNCICPDGFYGDGLKSKIGCWKNVNTSFKKIALGLGISLGAILMLLIGWWRNWFIKRRKIIRQKVENFERNGGLLLQQQMTGDETVAERMKLFSADELDKATDHFNENRILGQGGQGIVYKGMLGEGRIVAIKKSKGVDQCKSGEFINEVVILSQINHRNIVRLLGCCLEAEVPLLVYEFIPNGTLFHQIHYPNDDFQITWKMRLQIACDSAGALAYLHSSSSIPIFHRDIKSSNILLDEKYKAKLSDFGTSRTVNIDQTHVTTRVMGTFGYLDPEYFQSSQFTEKSDVYSFGVVLVELLTGQKAIRSIMEEDRSLTSWFLTHMESSTFLNIIDSQVLLEGSKEEFFTIGDLAKRCLNLDGKKRPYMKEVLTELEGVRSLHLPGVHEQKQPESKTQVRFGTTTNMYYNGPPKSSSLNIENSSSSAEFSLLSNPR